MRINKERNTYYVFVGGVSPYMAEHELKTALNVLGPIKEITLKMRPKQPQQNLGYGILATKSYSVYLELIRMHFYQLGQSKLEFKPYQDPKIAIKQSTAEAINFSSQLEGLKQGVTDKIIEEAIHSKLPDLKVVNIVIKKSHLDGLLTGEGKVIFETGHDLNLFRTILPLSLKMKKTATLGDDSDGTVVTESIEVTEKILYQTDRAQKKLQSLKKEGLIPSDPRKANRIGTQLKAQIGGRQFKAPPAIPVVNLKPVSEIVRTDIEILSESEKPQLQEGFYSLLKGLEQFNATHRYSEYFAHRQITRKAPHMRAYQGYGLNTIFPQNN